MLIKQLFNSEKFPTIVITNILQNIFCVSPMTRVSKLCQNSYFWLNPLTCNSEHSSKNMILISLFRTIYKICSIFFTGVQLTINCLLVQKLTLLQQCSFSICQGIQIITNMHLGLLKRHVLKHGTVIFKVGKSIFSVIVVGRSDCCLLLINLVVRCQTDAMGK